MISFCNLWRIQQLTSHLLVDVLDEGLTTSQDPPIHDILTLGSIVVVDELLARSSLVQLDLAEVEVEGIDPFQQDVGQDLSNTFLSESKIVTSYNGRVD
jgi:hypothetical protein